MVWIISQIIGMNLWETLKIPLLMLSIPTQNEEHVKLTPNNVEFALSEIYNGESTGNILPDQDKKSAFVFTENGNGDAFNGQIYRSSASQRARNGNGNDSTGEDNYRFGNIAHWSICMTTSDWSAQQVAEARGGFKDNQHPLYSGDDVLTQLHGGMGAVGWGSFTANAYNRAAGTGSVAMGYNNIAGTPEGKGAFSEDPANNSGQTVFGFASRATGNVSFASGFRNTAAGAGSVAMGNFNYATGDASIAIGKESYAEGAGTVAIKTMLLVADQPLQENISWEHKLLLDIKTLLGYNCSSWDCWKCYSYGLQKYSFRKKFSRI